MGEFTKTVAELQAESFVFGLDLYPIFDASYRGGLNAKILDHFKFHEICSEDAAVFKHYLNSTMNEIMPLFNKKYESLSLSYNPLLTFSRTEAQTGNSAVTSAAEMNGTQGRTAETIQTQVDETATNNASKNTGKNISSDTPQGLLSAGDISGNVWATNATMTENNQTDTGGTDTESNLDRNETETTTNANTSESTTTGSTTATITASGYDRPLAELVKLHRDTFLNIDMEVINSLRDCFLQIME